VCDEVGTAVALAQCIYLELPIIGGIARINRGPLMLGEIESSDQVSVDVIAALRHESKKRRWWVIQIAPELSDTLEIINSLKTLGLKQLTVPHSASGILSLSSNENDLLKGLNGKWRNCLRKGWKLGVTVVLKNGNSEALKLLLDRYDRLKNDKDFSGLSESLIVALSKQSADEWQFNLFIANTQKLSDVEQSIGMVVTVRHGNTSTYLIGYTNKSGRKLQANYVLLWHAILYAKDCGCTWFDIGGLNSTTPKGIAHFKKGIKSELYTLVGEWRG